MWKHGRRVAAEKTTIPVSRRGMLATKTRRERKASRVMLAWRIFKDALSVPNINCAIEFDNRQGVQQVRAESPSGAQGLHTD